MTPADFVERYQELLVGLIGFGGVILTLRAAAKATRDQHDRQLEARANGLRRALAEELRWAQEGVVRIISMFEGAAGSGDSVLVPELDRQPIYSASIDSVLLLSQAEVRAVSRAYASIREAHLKMGFFGDYEERTPHLRFVRVPSKNLERAAAVWRNHLRLIREGAEELQRHLDTQSAGRADP